MRDCCICGLSTMNTPSPSVFLAPAKLGRVPSGPTFEIEATPRGRRSRATRTQCVFHATFPSRAARCTARRRHPPEHPFQRHAAFLIIIPSYSARSSGLRAYTIPRCCAILPQRAPPCRYPEPVVHLVPLLLSPIRQDEARRDPSAAPYQRPPHLPTTIAKHRTTPRIPKRPREAWPKTNPTAS